MWVLDPSGYKDGDLEGWRKMILSKSPNPEKGEIVSHQYGSKDVHYRCKSADGSNSCWERVNNVEVPKNEGFVVEYDGAAIEEDQGVYLGDGVYINASEAWF